MAMEIKTLEVANDKEKETIEFWGQFGWVLKSSQRIYSQDSHLEKKGDDLYSVTKTVDFTKIVLERDKNNPNYSRIVELEKAYFYHTERLPKKKPVFYASAEDYARDARPDLRTGLPRVLPLILRISGIVMFLGGAIFSATESGTDSMAVPIALLGVPVFVASFISANIFKKSAISQALEGEGEPAEILKNKFANYSAENAKNKQALDEYNDTAATIAAILNELDTLV